MTATPFELRLECIRLAQGLHAKENNITDDMILSTAQKYADFVDKKPGKISEQVKSTTLDKPWQQFLENYKISDPRKGLHVLDRQKISFSDAYSYRENMYSALDAFINRIQPLDKIYDNIFTISKSKRQIGLTQSLIGYVIYQALKNDRSIINYITHNSDSAKHVMACLEGFYNGNDNNYAVYKDGAFLFSNRSRLIFNNESNIMLDLTIIDNAEYYDNLGSLTKTSKNLIAGGMTDNNSKFSIMHEIQSDSKKITI